MKRTDKGFTTCVVYVECLVVRNATTDTDCCNWLYSGDFKQYA